MKLVPKTQTQRCFLVAMSSHHLVVRSLEHTDSQFKPALEIGTGVSLLLVATNSRMNEECVNEESGWEDPVIIFGQNC